MSIYKDCPKCTFKRKYGCTRTCATGNIIGRVKGNDRKKARCSNFKLSRKRKKLR